MALRQKIGEDNPCYCCGNHCPSISEFVEPLYYGEKPGEKHRLWLYCAGCDPALDEADDSDGYRCPCGEPARRMMKVIGYAMIAKNMYDKMAANKPSIGAVVSQMMQDKYGND